MIVYTHRGETGEMGKILFSRRTEPATETEFPGGVMAAQVSVNKPQSPQSTWIKANLYKTEMASHSVLKHFHQLDSQEGKCFTSVSQTKPANTVKDITSKEDSSAHSEKLTREPDESPLERFSGKERFDWWNNPFSSCDESYQFYDRDQCEDKLWLNYERVDTCTDEKANNCFNETLFPSSSKRNQLSQISNHVTTVNPPDARGSSLENDKNNKFTKTEEKIRNLKALLAEQEKEIKRLKDGTKKGIFEAKACTTTKEECGFGTQLYENRIEVSEQSKQKLITKNDNFHEEQKTSVATCTKRKRIGRERTIMSNTKRFRYNLRKDVPQEIKSFSNQTTDQKRTQLLGKNSTFGYVKPDERKGTFTQDEFMSFLRLVRSTRSVL